MDYLTDSLCSCESSVAFSALTKRVDQVVFEVRLFLFCLGLIAWSLWATNRILRGFLELFREIIKDLDRLDRRG